MKKFIIAALAAVLAFTSCSLLNDPTFSLTNASAYLNCKDGKLITDGGTLLTVTADASDGKWNAEGNRMFALFDVLNANYDITLRSYYLATIQNAVKDSEPAGTPGDPITILDCSLSGIYLNILMEYYVKKGSETPHNMNLYWSDDSRTITFVLVHDGGGESLVTLPASDMERTVACYSFPINALLDAGETRTLQLTINALVKGDSSYTAESFTYSLYGSGVTF